MAKELYRELQQRLDLYSVGFPATASGVEIKILKALFSEEDASIFLKLTHLLEPPEAVAGNLGLSVAEARDKLADMAKRGLLFSKKDGGKTLYGTTAFVHGIYEYQTSRMSKELAELMEQYTREAFERNLVKHGPSFLRTIPVNKSLKVEHHVASYDDAAEILKNKRTIVVAECICRNTTKALGLGCGKLLEACLLFDSMGEYYIEHGLGTGITVDEALAIVKKGQGQGLVLQPATAQNPAGMCLCCGDCCGVLRAITSHPRPAEIVSSNHYVELDSSNCKACGACVKRCQTDALYPNSESKAVLNRDRCIGCGLCVTTCPRKCLTLLPKPREDRYALPKGSMEQMIAIARDRMVFNPRFLVGNLQIQRQIALKMLKRRVRGLIRRFPF
jgi:ferredoxin